MMENKRYIEKAKEMYQAGDGEIEIDDNAEVSTPEKEEEEGGAYVSAWVWVPDDEKEERTT